MIPPQMSVTDNQKALFFDIHLSWEGLTSKPIIKSIQHLGYKQKILFYNAEDPLYRAFQYSLFFSAKDHTKCHYV